MKNLKLSLKIFAFSLLVVILVNPGFAFQRKALVNEMHSQSIEFDVENASWHGLERDDFILIAWLQDSESKEIYQAENKYFDPMSIASSESAQPSKFQLQPAYPNPFNSSAIIPFRLAQNQTVKYELFDLSGRAIASENLGLTQAGSHNISFDAMNLKLNEGAYFIKITAGSNSQIRKVFYLK